jgi:hypothetical protein
VSYISTNTILAKSMKFIARISTMGDKKVVIYVPQEYHKEILQNFKGKFLKITIEEAI